MRLPDETSANSGSGERRPSPSTSEGYAFRHESRMQAKRSQLEAQVTTLHDSILDIGLRSTIVATEVSIRTRMQGRMPALLGLEDAQLYIKEALSLDDDKAAADLSSVVQLGIIKVDKSDEGDEPSKRVKSGSVLAAAAVIGFAGSKGKKINALTKEDFIELKEKLGEDVVSRDLHSPYKDLLRSESPEYSLLQDTFENQYDPREEGKEEGDGFFDELLFSKNPVRPRGHREVGDESPQEEKTRHVVRVNWDEEPLQDPSYYDGIPNPLKQRLQRVSGQLPLPGQGLSRRSAAILLERASGFRDLQAFPALRSTLLAGIIPHRAREGENVEKGELYSSSDIVAAIILLGVPGNEAYATELGITEKGIYDMEVTVGLRLQELGDHKLGGLLMRRFVDGNEMSSTGEIITPKEEVRKLIPARVSADQARARRRDNQGTQNVATKQPVSRPRRQAAPEFSRERLFDITILSDEQRQAIDELELDHKARERGRPNIPESLMPLLRNWNEVKTSRLIEKMTKRPENEVVSFDTGFDYPSYKALQFVVVADNKVPLDQVSLVDDRQLTVGKFVPYARYLRRRLKQISVENPRTADPSLETLYTSIKQQSDGGQ